MNKKFFTLMAAILVGGAAMPSDAFAQKVEFSSLAQKDSMIALSDGVKFYMGIPSSSNDTVAYAVRDSAGYSVLGECNNYLPKRSTLDTLSVFEVRNYSKADKTFELWADGKQFVHTKDGNVYKKFYGVKDWKPTEAADSTNIGKIFTAQIGTSGDDAFQDSRVFPMSARQQHSAGTLNAYLNKGVRMSYPDAQNLVSNPFSETMIALNPKELSILSIPAFEGCVNDSVVFVKKDDAYKAYDAATTATKPEKFKALSVAVVDPFDSYGITGLTGENGRVIKFVKGEVLAQANDKNKGLINKHNAMFAVGEGDMLNEYGYLSINGANITWDDATGTGSNEAWIGAYSLTTTGDSKSYVTTNSVKNQLTWAQVGAGTYANVAALLKADGPAVYTIFCQGTQPAAGTTNDTYYGKYLVNSETKLDTTALAPAQVDLTVADAQWIVSYVGSKGSVTFTSARDFDKKLNMTLYATDDPSVFKVSEATKLKRDGAETIKLAQVTEDNTYVSFTDAELADNIQFTFKGEGAVSVNSIYVKYSADTMFVATQNAAKNENFKLEKGDLIKKGYTYAYTDANGVNTKVDSLAVPSYKLTWSGKGLVYDKSTGTAKLDTTETAGENDQFRIVIKKNAEGHKHLFAYTGAYTKDQTFDERIAGTVTGGTPSGILAQIFRVNTSDAIIDTTAINDEELAYCNVEYSLSAQLGNSLPAVCKHVTFEGEDGAISWKETDNALEGVLSLRPLTFWLDTADSDKDVPAFYISKAVPEEEEMRAVATEPDRLMLFNPIKYTYYWDADNAAWKTNNFLYMPGSTNAKAVYAQAAITGFNKMIMVAPDGENVVNASADDVKAFKFNITEKDGGYAISSVLDGAVLYSLNGKLGFSANPKEALVVEVAKAEATANEAIEAAGVQVIGGQGVVTVQGAAGKVVTVANILGQTIANQVAASDNVTIAAPAGVVVVTVDGEATKVIVK